MYHHAAIEIGSQHHISGSGFWSTLKDKVTSAVDQVKYRLSMGNTNRPSPALQTLLNKCGDQPVIAVAVHKQPIDKAAQIALSALTLGSIDKKVKQLGEDNIFHTGLVITLQRGARILLEKNATLMAKEISNGQYTSNNVQLKVRPGLTLNKLIANASKTPQAAKTLFQYSARSDNGYNCQATARQLIGDSKEYFEEDAQTKHALHEQDAVALLSTLPQVVQALPDKTTDLGARVNRFIGKGIYQRSRSLASFI